MDDVALGRCYESSDQHRTVAHGKAHRRRSARRNLYDSGGKRRRAQPDEFKWLGGTRSFMVAGRKMDFVLQRSLRRISSLPRSAGWPDAAARNHTRSSDALLHAFMVA